MSAVTDSTGQDLHSRWIAAIDGFVFHGDRAGERKWARLKSHRLLAGCPLVSVRRVASVADEVSFAAGDVLAEQGRSPAWFFLIHSGEVEVVRDGRRLGVLGPGDHFGEVPLLGQGSHPATVRACTPVIAFVIGSQRFLPLVEDIGSLRADMDRALARQADLVVLARAERARHFHSRPGSPRNWRSQTCAPLVSKWRRVVHRVPPLRVRRRSSVRARVAGIAAAAAVLASLTLAASRFHPAYALVSPGPVIDVSRDITISGVPVHPPRGRYLLLAVRIERPSLLGLALAAVHRSGSVVRVQGAAGAGGVQQHHRLEAEFTHSQTDAVLAAADSLGLQPKGRAAFPFRVSFRHRDIVGPSAGLVYAMAIHDMLSASDATHGRTIAATGELDPAGNVEPVGYIGQKAVAARHAGAQLLVVPRAQVDDAVGQGLTVDGVRSLQEALADLGY
ncbi:MAG: hypothetical protein JWP02_1390 [Acidimicrobiales bacterium]|nr:hypothetical protein [Acidimicrobiales bacterium]